MSECEQKAYFVENQLFYLLRAIDANVKGAVYESFVGGRENVVILYKDGPMKNVNVTGDSLQAIARDVLKNI